MFAPRRLALPRAVSLPPVPSLLLAILSVQGGATVAKGLFPRLGPTGTVSLRTGFAALILLLVFRPPLARLTRAQWQSVIPYGMVLGTMNLCFYLSIARIPLGLGVTLEFLGPLALALVGSRRALDFLWVVLAGAGVALIVPWNGGGTDPVGIALALLTGVCWAAYIVLGGRVSQVLPGGHGVAVGMVCAALTVLPFALLGGGFAHLTLPTLASGALLGLLSGALPFALEMNALRALSARTFSILVSLEPAVGALCGLLILSEHLSPAQWIAVVLIIAASIGATQTARKSVIPTPVD